jgi:hypothetical protein
MRITVRKHKSFTERLSEIRSGDCLLDTAHQYLQAEFKRRRGASLPRFQVGGGE